MAIAGTATIYKDRTDRSAETITYKQHIAHDTASGDYLIPLPAGSWKVAITAVETETFADAGTINSTFGIYAFLDNDHTIKSAALGLCVPAATSPASTFTIVKGAGNNQKYWLMGNAFGVASNLNIARDLPLPFGISLTWTKGATPGTAGEIDLYITATRIS